MAMDTIPCRRCYYRSAVALLDNDTSDPVCRPCHVQETGKQPPSPMYGVLISLQEAARISADGA
jgi:hypothetical protein